MFKLLTFMLFNPYGKKGGAHFSEVYILPGVNLRRLTWR